MTHVDVAIAGGGPAGLALAILLVQRGVSVRVLEERAHPGTRSRAIGLHPPGLGVLDLAGVGAAAVEAGVRIAAGVALDGTALAGKPPRRAPAVASMDFGVLPGPHRYVLALPQTTTQALLEERLGQLDPRALRRGVRVEAFHAHRDGVQVHTSNSGVPAPPAGRPPNGAPPNGPQPNGAPPNGPHPPTGAPRPPRGEPASGLLTARFLVGADGVRSGTRQALGLPFRGEAHPDRYVMADYPDTTDFGSTAVLFLHPEGIVESFPLPGGLRRWVARLADGPAPHRSPFREDVGAVALWAPGAGDILTPGMPIPDRARETLPATIAHRTGHTVEAAGVAPAVFGTARRRVPKMSDGPVLLIGDAAHEVSPIGGQGMTLGLLDAAQLAGILCEALGLGEGRNAGHGTAQDAATAAALERFSVQRLEAARAAGRAAHLNMVLGRPLPGPLMRGRNRAIGALIGLGAVHDAVARRFTMQG